MLLLMFYQRITFPLILFFVHTFAFSTHIAFAFSTHMADKFDDFLKTFGNKDLEILVRESATSAKGKKRPISPVKSKPAVKARQPAAEVDSPVSPPTPEQPATSSSSTPKATSSTSTSNLGFEDRLKELERKVHNQGRGGRNRLYYEILTKYGQDAARPFFVPPGAQAPIGLTPNALNLSAINPPPPPAKVAPCPPPPSNIYAPPPWLSPQPMPPPPQRHQQ